MNPNGLAQPVGALLRRPPGLGEEDSLGRAAALFRETPFGVLPITDLGRLRGVISQRSLARAFGEGASPNDPCMVALDPDVPVVHYLVTGAVALRMFVERQADEAVVVDENGFAMGVVSPSDLFPRRDAGLRPLLVGGMATPFGVYLTNGVVRAGASDLALVATGMLLFTLFVSAVVGAEYLALWGETARLAPTLVAGIRDFLPFVLFLLALRLLPLAGIHAAEHKVVHAIERGEPLVPEIVSRMPRVHPRCGTNLAVGASLFLTMASAPFVQDMQLRLLLAAVLTLFLWRPLGNLMQYWVTTRPPSRKHLEMGIRSGRELLEKIGRSSGAPPSLFHRLYASGMFHVITGSMLGYGLVRLAAWALRVDLGL